MSSQKIFLFDFDGVIVDGMQEYWHSSLLACERYLNSPNITIDQKLYQGVPNSFKEIRPWVKYGWEMILIVHEIIKKENPLKSDNKDDFINNYHQNFDTSQSDLTIEMNETLIQLDDVVITSTRTGYLLRDVPIATEVIGSKEIDDSGAITVGELLSQRSGVSSSLNVDGGENFNMLGLDSKYILILKNNLFI